MILAADSILGPVLTISVNLLRMVVQPAVPILELSIWLDSLKMCITCISRNGQTGKSCIYFHTGTGPRDRKSICGVIIIWPMKWNCSLTESLRESEEKMMTVCMRHGGGNMNPGEERELSGKKGQVVWNRK